MTSERKTGRKRSPRYMVVASIPGVTGQWYFTTSSESKWTQDSAKAKAMTEKSASKVVDEWPALDGAYQYSMVALIDGDPHAE